MAANQQAIQRYAVIGDQDFGAFLQRRGQEFNELLKKDRVQFTCQDAPHGWKHQVPNARHYASVNKRESNPNNIQMNVACWLGTVSHLDAQEDGEVARRAVENALSMIFDLERTCVHLREGYPHMSHVNEAFLTLIAQSPWNDDDNENGNHNGNGNEPETDNESGDPSDQGEDVDEGLAPNEDLADKVADGPFEIRHWSSLVVTGPWSKQVICRYVVIKDIQFGHFLQSVVAELNAILTPSDNQAPEIGLKVTRAPEGWRFPDPPGALYNPSHHENGNCYIARVHHAKDQELVGFVSEWLNLMDDAFHNIIHRDEAKYHAVNTAWKTMVRKYAGDFQLQNE